MPFLLAIDQSTSATKVILFTTQGKVLDKSPRNHRQIYPQPGWVEHDANEIFFQLCASVRKIAKRNSKKFSKLAGLSITNQSVTIGILDAQSGKPLRKPIVRQDRRGDPICQKLIQQGYEPLVQRKTGLKIDTYFSASKLRWVIENRADIAAMLK